MTEPSRSDDEVDAMMFRARMPSIAMLPVPRDDDGTLHGTGTPGCWLRGAPSLPPEYEWPIFTFPHEPYQGFQVPMHFVVQINLQYLPRVLGLPELPPKGTLFVFYDPVIAPFETRFRDVSPLHSGEAVRIIYHPEDASSYPLRTPPPLPDLTPLEDQLIYEDGGLESGQGWPYDFVVIDTYPTLGTTVDGLRRVVQHSEETEIALVQALGWSCCAEVREREWTSSYKLNCIFGASKAQSVPQTKAQLAQRDLSHFPTLTEEDVLLFRLPFAQIAWGDQCTTFWINKKDLQNADFSNVSIWME